MPSGAVMGTASERPNVVRECWKVWLSLLSGIKNYHVVFSESFLAAETKFSIIIILKLKFGSTRQVGPFCFKYPAAVIMQN